MCVRDVAAVRSAPYLIASHRSCEGLSVVTDTKAHRTTYGPLLENEQGVSYAIDLIREVTLTLDAVENRSKLYLVAGEIYE